MKELICINPKNYKLTLDKNYTIVIDEGETVMIVNDNNKTNFNLNTSVFNKNNIINNNNNDK